MTIVTKKVNDFNLEIRYPDYKKAFYLFVTSLVVVTVLVWANSQGKLLELPVFQDFSHNPWFMVLAHFGAFDPLAPACAGYEGIGLISVFVGSYLWLMAVLAIILVTGVFSTGSIGFTRFAYWERQPPSGSSGEAG